MTNSSVSPMRGVRVYIREQYDKIVRSRSHSLSRHPTEASNSTLSPASAPPRTVGNFLAPPSEIQVPQLRHSRSDSHLSATLKHRTESKPENVAWTGLKGALEELRKVAKPFPPLASAIGSLIPCLGLLETATNNRKEYEEIVSELKSMCESLTGHMKETSSVRMSRCIANVAMCIEQQTKLISKKQNRSTGMRVLEASTDEEEMMSHYRKIESLFRRLQTDANLSTWSIANEVLANTRLEGLAPAKLANYDSRLSVEISRRTCTEGTRTKIMSEIDEWSLDSNAPDLYLISGMAGTGKTTIACSFANQLEERKQLAASFFCTRTTPECRDAGRIVPTIAYQLARYSTPFQSALCEVLGEDPDIGTKNIVKQFERLLVEPLLKVKDAIPENLVVVIDALDECDDGNTVRLVLDLLFKFALKVPLKFFVTSRPEPEIYNKMFASSPTSRMTLHLHEIEKSLVQADIELYLKEELSAISPTEDEIVQLAVRSGSLFIYAATLVRYIRPLGGSVNPQRRLRAVLAIKSDSMSKYAEIDTLYAAVLKSAFEQNGLDSEEAEDVRATLWTVLCVREPINVDTLAALAGINDTERTLSALRPLRSVIHLSEASGLISTLHASFPDFMFDKERSGSLFCDPTLHNQLLADRCFDIMKAQLRFNICNLESSYVPDAEVEGLEDRISKTIPLSLLYVCQYWADHLTVAPGSGHLCDVLQEFLSVRLLFWIEVLNLKHETIRGLEILVKTNKWLHMMPLSPGLVRFVEDARNFLTSYAASPISQFTPHLYISSLALCPRSSLVYKKYQPLTRGLIGLEGSGLDRLETVALAVWEIHSEVIRSVSYSPDGSQVAFGCDDGTMGVRNAYDGSSIISPFKGHSGIVCAVAFSPDGTRFVSGSDDRTIKLWNAQAGTLAIAGESFQGHTGQIKSVAFSLDGRSIASGSADQTVRIWSASNGAPVGDPLRGHTRCVSSVAFSPDGTRVISGSHDYTIRVWNIQDSTLAFDPLVGHSGVVWSVAFSPDGTRIVSGSSDRTIRLWSAQDGLLVLGPLGGHTKEIHAVAFSPEGSRILSSSRDQTLLISNAENGELITGPLEGHTNVIFSVAFSPDGTRVISSAGDRTIRVWNASAGKVTLNPFKGHTDGISSIALARDGDYVASGTGSIHVWDSQNFTYFSGPFEGHTDFVRSVALSPDGKQLVSGSDDSTVRVWDVSKSTLLAGPFTDHSKGVNSVAFSPDGAYIASGSSDRTVCVRSLSEDALISPPFKGHTDAVWSVAFSPDGSHVVSGSYDSTIRVWDIRKGAPAIGPFLGHTHAVTSVTFSPCGQYIAASLANRTIRVWNSQNGTPVTDPFTGHTDLIHSVAFSSNSACIVSCSSDRTVRVWHTHSGTLVAGPFYGHVAIASSAAFLPDNRRLVSGSWDHTIRMWDLSDLQPILSTSEPSSALLSLDSASPVTPSRDWIVKNDGWITDHDGSVLFWAPPEIVRCLITPHCSSIISPFGTIEVDMASALFGDHWKDCYLSVV